MSGEATGSGRRWRRGQPGRAFSGVRLVDGYLISDDGVLSGDTMCRVQMATDAVTMQQVALKSVPADKWTPELAARLEREAEVLRLLDHEDIAHFVAFREIDGVPRLVIRWVEGKTLADWMARVPGPSLEERIRLLERVARAMDFAHSRMVAHRDLKPQNIMVREDGSPVVLDFGISALLDAAGGKIAALTQTNAAAGTPLYMAPEQMRARGDHPAAGDVYALGLILFELVTGELPVPRGSGESVAVYLKRVLESKPRRLREADPRADRSLEAICVRALHPEPAERRSAGEFAEQLRRWLAKEPVEWRTFSARERAVLAFRRHPWRWLVAAGALVVVVVVAVVMTWLAGQRAEALAKSRKTEAASLAAVVAEAATRGKVDEVTDDLQRALWLDPENEVAGWLAGQSILDRMRLRPVARVAFSTGLLLARDFVKGHRVLYAVRQDDGVLCRGKVVGDGSGLEWVPWPDERTGCMQVEQSRDGVLLAGLYKNGSLRLWDAETGKERGAVAAHSAAEHSMYVSISGKLAVHVASTAAVEAASAVLRVISTEDGRVLRSFTLPHYMHREYVAVTFDDRWLVMGAAHQSWLGVMDLADGTLRDLTGLWEGWKLGGVGAVHRLCALPDRPLVLLGGQCMGMRVACLNAEAGTMVWDQEVLGRPRRYTAAVEDIELVPGGEWFAVTGSEGDLMLHRLADGSPKGELMSCPVRGRSIEFIGEDLLVLSGAQRTTVWNWRTGTRLTAPVARCLSPLGDGLFFEPGAQEVKLWRMEGTPARQRDFKLGDGKAAFDLSGDRQMGLFSVSGGRVVLVDLENLTVLRAMSHEAPVEKDPRRMVARPRLSADATRAVTWVNERTLAVHDLRAPQDASAVRVECQEPVTCAALSPEGERLALFLQNGIWEMRSALTGGLLYAPRDDLRYPPPNQGTDQPGRGLSMEFSRDGARLGIGTSEWTTVTLWNVTDGKVIQPPFGCGHVVRTVRFGADGVLWSGDWNGDCQKFLNPPPYVSHPLPPAESVRPPLAKLYAPVADIVLSENGAWVTAASLNGSAVILDQATLQKCGEALEHTGEVTAVDWSPDATRLLTASTAGDVFIWNRETGRAMLSWPQQQPVVQAAFALVGKRIVFAGMDGVVRVREVYGGGMNGQELGRRLESVTGRKAGDDGQVLPVPGE